MYSDTAVYGSKYPIQGPYLVIRSIHFYFSSKYVTWLYVPTERHITMYRYFLRKNGRAAFINSHRIFNLCRRNSQMVTCTISGTWLNRVRHDSLWVKTSNASPMFCGSLLILLFLVKYVTWLYVPSQRHITTYRYFFVSSRMKKAFKLGIRASFGMAKCLYLF